MNEIRRKQLKPLIDGLRELSQDERERMRREFRFAVELARKQPAGVCAAGVVVLYNDRVWRVVGGSVESPTLKLEPNVSPDDVWWA